MAEAGKVRIATTDDIPAGGMKSYEIEETLVIIVNIEGQYYAFYSSCPHQGGPLEEGVLYKEIIECPRHHHRFDVRTGENIYPKNVYPENMKYLQEELRPLRVLPLEVRGKDILLELQ